MPFAWGSNDCALFYGGAILAMTGVDLAKPWRGYSTARGARARVSKVGGLLALALKAGLREKPRDFAQRGDGVLVSLQGRDTLGLCVGSGSWCGPGESGLVFRPMNEVITALEF